jgi:hypothetical protein
MISSLSDTRRRGLFLLAILRWEALGGVLGVGVSEPLGTGLIQPGKIPRVIVHFVSGGAGLGSEQDQLMVNGHVLP